MARTRTPTKGEFESLLARERPSAATPHRAVLSEVSHANGVRELHLSCGHMCRTRDKNVYLTLPCLLCPDETISS